MKRFVEILDSAEEKISDLLSPMLIKELRQGMRSRVFVASFLLIQALMFFSVILSLLHKTDSGGIGEFDKTFFWMMIAVPLLFIMPIRGYNTLAGEIKGRTLELVFLTRLTPWRIVAGKWAALFAQTFLIVCAVLPYTVVRYYLGGVDLFVDLQTLLFMFLLSGLLTGMTVGLSAYASRLLKVFHLLAILMAIFVLPSLFVSLATGPVVRFGYDLVFYAGFAVYGTLYLLLMLEMGASKIAPPAENHAFRTRLIGLILCVALIVFAFFKVGVAIAIASMGTLALICMGGMCEEPRPIPTLYQPFALRGFGGRLAGRLFYPGWPSAVLYFVLVSLGCVMALQFYSLLNDQALILTVSFIGGAIAPVAIAKFFAPGKKISVVYYLVVQSVLCVITPVICAIDVMFKVDLKLALSVFPTSVLLLAMSDAIDDHESLFLGTSALVTAACFVMLLFRSIPAWREIGKLEKQSIELGKPADPEKLPKPEHADAAAS